MTRLHALALVALAAACSPAPQDHFPRDAAVDGAAAHCSTVADCPVNAGASCARVCSDGSNPCGTACVDGQCVERGCPGDHDMAGASDAGLPDAATGGDDAGGDGGACAANGAGCNGNGDCCSGNCITRFVVDGGMGYCCVPGGCP